VYKSFLKAEVIFYVHQGCIYLQPWCTYLFGKFIWKSLSFFSGFLDTKKDIFLLQCKCIYCHFWIM